MADRFDDLMKRRPTGSFAVELSRRVHDEFWERGFAKIARVTTDEELDWMREVYDLLLSGEVDLRPGSLTKDVMSAPDKQRGEKLGQVLNPEARFPELKDTIFWQNSQKVAKLLLGEEQRLYGWGHMIRKSPRDDSLVPWHQDEAYWDPGFDYDAALFWMPLDPATIESGCMSFLPGSHKDRVLRHGFMNNDPSIYALKLDEEIDDSTSVPEPVPIGGVSIHHSRVLHWSGPNKTANQRRAFVNGWARPPAKRDVPFDRPWYFAQLQAKHRHFGKEAFYHG
jgi:hypothetical protein